MLLPPVPTAAPHITLHPRELLGPFPARGPQNVALGSGTGRLCGTLDRGMISGKWKKKCSLDCVSLNHFSMLALLRLLAHPCWWLAVSPWDILSRGRGGPSGTAGMALAPASCPLPQARCWPVTASPWFCMGQPAKNGFYISNG